jgi:anaphase-promoting complex subunit 2
MLLQFETRERISAAELASLVGVPQAAVRKRALFWVNNGVLAESRIASGQVVYSRATALDPARATCTDASELPPDDDPQAAAASDEERLLTEMSPYENYIIGMLTNFASLTLERLHNMLRMFVISPKYDKSQEQLADFLAHLVGRERVAVEGALYKRKKTG